MSNQYNQYNQHSGANPSTPVVPTTMTDDILALANRLGEVRVRISKFGDSLHGPIPREAAIKGEPSQVPSIRSHIDASIRILNEIDTEFSRIEQRLG